MSSSKQNCRSARNVCSLITVFVVHCFATITSLACIIRIVNFYVICVASQFYDEKMSKVFVRSWNSHLFVESEHNL